MTFNSGPLSPDSMDCGPLNQSCKVTSSDLIADGNEDDMMSDYSRAYSLEEVQLKKFSLQDQKTISRSLQAKATS